MERNTLRIGIDVGSTTVKAVVMDEGNRIVWQAYKRHNAKQAELVLELLYAIEDAFPNAAFTLFITGSGGRGIAGYINARYIQEVNAVTYAVEKLYPETGSVIELGGQDAKVIIWKEDEYGQKSTITFMNDKCAGGTGATVDKIVSKIGLPMEDVRGMRLNDTTTMHHIAAKCGVFAETDVVGLLKSGVHTEEIVASFCNAIVKQNLEVLVRGNVLKENVLLLGGPNTFIPLFLDVWRRAIPRTWEEHTYVPANRPVEELIFVPENAQYFAAIGAVLFGDESRKLFRLANESESDALPYEGTDALVAYIEKGRTHQLLSYGAVREGLVKNEEEVRAFAKEYAVPPFETLAYPKGTHLKGYIGIDGGSTSSKLAIVDEEGTLFYKDYMLSKGNPISDVKAIFARLHEWLTTNDLALTVLGAAVTGYASEIVGEAFALDLRIVETVAHMRASSYYYGEVDVICDIGGQDIKILFMKNNRVVDFKLNTQCSAGNGYFLQGMAQQFNVPIEEYATRAFSAKKAPAFNYGCAVFMEQDKVNFQQLGWSKDEIMAGLALVLPLNVWNYVVQEANIAKFGTRFVLQGGTQKNLAAVKTQVDYIKERIPNAKVHVHRYADICGAIGAALELKETMGGRETSFIGIEAGANVTFTTVNDESTRCRFCSNRCPRIFIDIKQGAKGIRFITGAQCEKGLADNKEDMQKHLAERKEVLAMVPNLVYESAQSVFEAYHTDAPPNDAMNNEGRAFRKEMIIGVPRVLNLYVFAPFFNAYFRALGVADVVYSDYTSQKLWEDGNQWGSIDPCFPAKVAPAHIVNLMKKDVTHIAFPIVTYLQTHLENTLGNNACVIQMGTPEVVHAAFTRERDHFEEKGITYWKPLVRMDRPLETEACLFEYFRERLRLTEEENRFATKEGFRAQDAYYTHMQLRGKEVISQLVRDDAIGIVVLGHPYHHDPGLNHGLLEEFQVKGFPILCTEAIPLDDEFLTQLYPGKTPRDIRNVWLRNFNRNTNHKIWAATVVSRHPNLAAIDLSSFKCGHDAPTYSYIDNIMDATGTPHFLFHDIDQNKPRASMKIRIQTIEYFLRLEEEKLRARVREHTHA